MDLFIILGIFPLVFNMLSLLNINLINKDNILSHNVFFILTVISTIIWLIWGFFSKLWILFLILILVNNFIFQPLKRIFKYKDNIIVKLPNLFTIFMILLIFCYRLNILLWSY